VLTRSSVEAEGGFTVDTLLEDSYQSIISLGLAKYRDLSGGLVDQLSARECSAIFYTSTAKHHLTVSRMSGPLFLASYLQIT